MKGKFLKFFKKTNKKMLGILLIVSMVVSSTGLPPYLIANAITNTMLKIEASDSDVTISNEDNNSFLEFYDGDTLLGSVAVKLTNSADYLTPQFAGGDYVVDVGNDSASSVIVEMAPAVNHQVLSQYSFGSNSSSLNMMPLSGTNINLTLTGGILNIIQLGFEEAGLNPPSASGTEIVVLNTIDKTSSIDPNDSTSVIYKSNNNMVIGSAKLKVGGTYATPTLDPVGNAHFDIVDYVDEAFDAMLEVIPLNGTGLDMFYHIDGTQFRVPGDNKLSIHITENKIYTVSFNLGQSMPVNYPLKAYFGDNSEGVLLNDEGVIVMPEDFTTGDIVIKALACESSDMILSPDNGQPNCGNHIELDTHIEGIINGEELGRKITPDSSKIIVEEDVNSIGRISLHITSADIDGPQINTLLNIISSKYMRIGAYSPIDMSYSFGTVNQSQANITNDGTKDVSIFFGNVETTLVAEGLPVNKITNVEGNFKSVVLNEDGTASVQFVNLNKETTTKAVVSILLTNGTTIKRTINIKRTALTLQHNDGGGDDSVYAGYVVNKGYLYNNQDHNDEVFNAYLQVMLYKDDTVVGYKQIKIDDEDLINRLEDDESGSLELYSENQIPIYGKATDDLQEGVNKISVLLTNGPVEFDKDLPSIEFGIGSGIVLEWEQR